MLPLAPVDDCCLTNYEKEQLHEISLQKPLTNILSSVEDLNLASIKIDEIKDLINMEQAKIFEHFKVLSTTWGTVVLTIILFSICIFCSCCYCKCSQCAFWFGTSGHPRSVYVIQRKDVIISMPIVLSTVRFLKLHPQRLCLFDPYL